MSFDNEHPNRKDWRRPYYLKRRNVSRACRPHGGCPACQKARRLRLKAAAADGDWSLRAWREGRL